MKSNNSFNRAFFCLFFVLLFFPIFSQVTFDTIVYRKGGENYKSFLENKSFSKSFVGIKNDEGNDVYFFKTGELGESDLSYDFAAAYNYVSYERPKSNTKFCIKDEKVGLADSIGNILLAPQFEYIKKGNCKDYFLARRNDSIFVVGADKSPHKGSSLSWVRIVNKDRIPTGR